MLRSVTIWHLHYLQLSVLSACSRRPSIMPISRPTADGPGRCSAPARQKFSDVPPESPLTLLLSPHDSPLRETHCTPLSPGRLQADFFPRLRVKRHEVRFWRCHWTGLPIALARPPMPLTAKLHQPQPFQHWFHPRATGTSANKPVRTHMHREWATVRQPLHNLLHDEREQIVHHNAMGKDCPLQRSKGNNHTYCTWHTVPLWLFLLFCFPALPFFCSHFPSINHLPQKLTALCHNPPLSVCTPFNNIF